MHISLTPQLEDIVKSKVNSGLYNNSSEVIREALRIMVTKDELYQTKLETLRKEVAIGAIQAENGEFTSQTIEEIIAEAKAELENNE